MHVGLEKHLRRSPFAGRCIDLSVAAARALGISDLARVRVEALD
jgi:rare lipoprotein A (peptidoglycan hydrolase)